MMLFDVIRKLNDEISLSLNKGMPGKSVPLLTATTDGYNVVINFVDKTVWESHTWEYHTYPSYMSEDEQMTQETLRIIAHIKMQVMEYLMTLFQIQW